MNIDELLTLTIHHHASDLHLSAGLPPIIRIDGDLMRLEMPVLENDHLQNMLQCMLNDQNYELLKQKFEIDFAYSLPEIARFRVNVFYQQRGIAAAFRVIPWQIPNLQELECSAILQEFCLRSSGLILVTGPTGSGKTSTLAAILHYINAHQRKHIITIEDPIEFIHVSRQCLINQREVHRDSKSFGRALRAALREDPDIIFIGELRDLTSIRLALTAAETGHLVFATLHTQSAAKTIDRIVDVFPGTEKTWIRTLLSESLYAIISQILLKRPTSGRIAAQEILICTPAIRNLIRENKIAQIYTAMQTGQAVGMRTLAQHIDQLTANNKIQ